MTESPFVKHHLHCFSATVTFFVCLIVRSPRRTVPSPGTLTGHSQLMTTSKTLEGMDKTPSIRSARWDTHTHTWMWMFEIKMESQHRPLWNQWKSGQCRLHQRLYAEQLQKQICSMNYILSQNTNLYVICFYWNLSQGIFLFRPLLCNLYNEVFCGVENPNNLNSLYVCQIYSM